jgi:large subunit ribosomal protein L4
VAVIKKYNLSGQEIGQVVLEDHLLQVSANPQMVKDYLVAYRANQRQWSANTKSRAEVSHSGQKPHPQKGTGRARLGYLGSPQYKGGGRVFGPKPKFDQQVRVNKKEKRAVIRSLLAQKIQEQHFHILSAEGLDAPKTKVMADFLKKLGLSQKRVLFLGEDLCLAADLSIDAKLDAVFETGSGSLDEAAAESAVEKILNEEGSRLEAGLKKRGVIVQSLRNIPKLKFSSLPNLHGYDVVLHQDIVLLDGNIEQLVAVLGGGN